jgi:uncharacterized protein YegJ (DUF2314 family)
MPPEEITAIVLLLAYPRTLEQLTLQSAAEFAFAGAPAKPTITPVPGKSAFAITLGPLRIGVISGDRPYFKDSGKIADRIRDVAGRQAVIQHTAWLSFDLIGRPPSDPEKIFNVIGCVAAEFLDDNVLGMMRLPHGPVVGYDISFIPKLRNRKASEIFLKATPDRMVNASANNQALAAAAEEARRRWPEFVRAFSQRRPGEGFAVKKPFKESGKVEHMWVEVHNIQGSVIHGALANEPSMVKSLKLDDVVDLSIDEIEDWIYMRGMEQVGGFQANVLRNR